MRLVEDLPKTWFQRITHKSGLCDRTLGNKKNEGIQLGDLWTADNIMDIRP